MIDAAKIEHERMLRRLIMLRAAGCASDEICKRLGGAAAVHDLIAEAAERGLLGIDLTRGRAA